MKIIKINKYINNNIKQNPKAIFNNQKVSIPHSKKIKTMKTSF